MESKNSPELIAGPYNPPKVRIGDWLDDEIDGAVVMGGWSTGPIPWPKRKKTGNSSLILCGDLVRAVQTESSLAVQHWFGVSGGTVWKWRKALNVGRQNCPGTHKLYQELAPTKLTPERAAKGRAICATAEVIARMADGKRGKPAHPKTLIALSKGRSGPKPEGWGARANEWMLKAKKAAK